MTIVTPRPDASFDPTRIPKAVEGAGFSAPKVVVVVAGVVERADDVRRLRVPGLEAPLILEGGEVLATVSPGAKVTITGELRVDEKSGEARLVAEKVE